MTVIGDYAEQFTVQSFEQYMAEDPPAVLLRHMAPIAFLPVGAKAGDTDGRLILQHGAGTPSGISEPTSVPPEQSYRVFRVQSASGGAGEGVKIGRSSACDIRLDDEAIDDEHLTIERQGMDHSFVDRDSLTGTALNGQYVDPGIPYPLRPGDRLTIGSLDLTFLDAGGFYHFVRRFLELDGRTQ